MWLLVVLSALVSGCLPSSCSNTESRALSPADSISRAFALSMPVDTLVATSTILPSDSVPFEHPRTIEFSPDGSVWIADPGVHRVFSFDSLGVVAANIDASEFKYPYLAGFRSDTTLVFSPDAHVVAFLSGGHEVRSVPIRSGRPGTGKLEYVRDVEGALYYKVLGKDFEGYLARLDDDGRVAEQFALRGPEWRFAGLLRAWGDSLVSLAGYLPVVDVLTAGIGPDYLSSPGPDSLLLTGFDSPMLSRTRSFRQGDVSAPPLLSASAAPAGGFLFVLNMRPGWLNIDVYDHAGMLRYILTQPDPAFNTEYYPSDIAVRRSGLGSFEFAIAVIKPDPRIDRYTWTQSR